MEVIELFAGYKQTASISELTEALVALQSKLQTLSKDKKNYTSKYLTLDKLLESIRQPLAGNGLVVTQHLAAGHVVTGLYHKSGQFITSAFEFVQVDLKGQASNMQKAGAGITYLKRYALMAILGISTTDEDNDGNVHADLIGKGDLPASYMSVEKLLDIVKGSDREERTMAWLYSDGIKTEQSVQALITKTQVEKAEQSAENLNNSLGL